MQFSGEQKWLEVIFLTTAQPPEFVEYVVHRLAAIVRNSWDEEMEWKCNENEIMNVVKMARPIECMRYCGDDEKDGEDV